jgi:hypothetical protein
VFLSVANILLSYLHSNATTSQLKMTDVSDTSRPWRGLPDELIIKILEYLLLSNKRKSLTKRGPIMCFLLTSKHMSELALEVWGRNRFVLRVVGRNPVPSTPAYVGRHIRRLELWLDLPATFEWNDLDSNREASITSSPWRRLLSYSHHDESPASAWQRAFTNLSELRVHLYFYSSLVWRHCVDGAPAYPHQSFLATASCDLRASHVEVWIGELGCVGDEEDVGLWYLGYPQSLRQPCCSEKLADNIRSLMGG